MSKFYLFCLFSIKGAESFSAGVCKFLFVSLRTRVNLCLSCHVKIKNAFWRPVAIHVKLELLTGKREQQKKKRKMSRGQ